MEIFDLILLENRIKVLDNFDSLELAGNKQMLKFFNNFDIIPAAIRHLSAILN